MKRRRIVTPRDPYDKRKLLYNNAFLKEGSPTVRSLIRSNIAHKLKSIDRKKYGNSIHRGLQERYNSLFSLLKGLPMSNSRDLDTLRPIHIQRGYTKHAAGSVLISIGDTKVLCTASVSESVPRFLRDANQGWLTAEYSMLPSATHTRTNREAARGKQSGRTVEIQRLIGRSLRQCIDLSKLPGITITIDCDVLQADGGTRCAAITGGCVALHDAISHLLDKKKIKKSPWVQHIAAISVGMAHSFPVLDLDYELDSQAETDMNVVMSSNGDFVEIQGTAEKKPFSETELTAMLELAKKAAPVLFSAQKDT